MSLSLVKLVDVSKKYLNNVKYNLTINRGDFILVTGANGSGKTTLVKLILGFIRPDSGEVIKRSRLKIGFLPEKAELPENLCVYDYLKCVAEIKKCEINLNIIVKLEIPLYKKIEELSKGNKQKVAIAATLLGYPDLVILDEPLSGLDSKTTRALKKIIFEYQILNKAFLISTHSPRTFKKQASKHIEL